MDKAFKGTGCESGIAIFACKESLEIMFTVPLIQRNKQTSKKIMKRTKCSSQIQNSNANELSG